MGALFNPPKMSKIEMPKAAPTIDTPAVQAAADATRMRERRSSGRAATMLTSGDESELQPRVGTKKLLGS